MSSTSNRRTAPYVIMDNQKQTASVAFSSRSVENDDLADPEVGIRALADTPLQAPPRKTLQSRLDSFYLLVRRVQVRFRNQTFVSFDSSIRFSSGHSECSRCELSTMFNSNENSRVFFYFQRFRRWMQKNQRRQVTPQRSDSFLEKFAPSNKNRTITNENRFSFSVRNRNDHRIWFFFVQVKVGLSIHRNRFIIIGRRLFRWPFSTTTSC